MSESLGVSVIGAGQMGSRHVQTLERLPGARLISLADPDEARARACIARRPIAWDADWRATFDRDEVQAVIVAVPTALHAEIAHAALDAGRHVLVEKPIASELPDALRLATAARERGRKLMVGHVERFNPAVDRIRQLLEEGRLGQVWRAQAVRVGPLPMRIRDAGVAIDLATHDLDIMQHVLRADLTHVYAEGARFAHASEEDMLACLLRFGHDGPFGLLDVNWLTPEKRRELTVIGEGGLLRADYLSQDVWWVQTPSAPTEWEEIARLRGDAEGAMVRFALAKREPLQAELEAFVTCVLEDQREPVTGWEGARALAAALAVRDSAAARRPLELLSMPAEPACVPSVPR